LYTSEPHWLVNFGCLCFFSLKEINQSPADKTTHQFMDLSLWPWAVNSIDAVWEQH
jgi:hypothetical protein